MTGRRAAPREQSAVGLDSILAPRSVAVVGASRTPSAVGHRLLRAILDGGYRGELWAVNPKAKEIEGVACFASVSGLPAAPDLAVIALPAGKVVAAAQECARAGVRGLLVISAGFRETGDAGAELERRLTAVVRENGMRMVGPNCVGVLHTPAAFDTVFAAHAVRPGRTALISQSGAVGIGLLHLAHRHHLGVASFVSLGNKSDVSGNDLLMAWENDDSVRQMVLYLEGFGNPRNFVRIARRVTRKKPVLMVKSGRSAAASRAAASHTGALADSDRTVAAMLRQCGVLRFDTVQGMFDAALAFEHLDPPRGDRVAIVTNSGGPAIMATDALPPQRLRLAEFGDATMRVLRGLLPAAAALANPVDTLAGADTDTFVRAVGAALADDGVDAVLAVHTAVFGDQDGLLAPLARLRARHPGKPVVVVLYGGAASGGATAVAGGVAGGVAGPMVSGVAGGVAGALVAAGVPTYAFPEEAVAALGALWRWERWRARPPQEPFTSTRDAALPAAGGWTTSSAALAAVAAAGLPVAPHAVAADEDEALAAAERIGYPVVIKADVADVVHKSDAGLVALDLRDGDAVRDAWRRVAARAGEPRETLVMRHATPGLEILLGAVQDERFGPLVAFGLGGTQAEALADVHFRLAPLTADDADHLIAELRASALLGPFRGAPARDTAALRSALLRLAALADRNPRIAELDVNPLLLYEKGALVVDARMRLASSP